MNIISRAPTHKRSRIRGIGMLAAGLFFIFWCSGCLGSQGDSNPSGTSAPAPAIPPTSSQPTTLQAIDSGTEFTVVGIKPGQDLPLFQLPSKDAEVLGSIPSAGMSIHPVLGASEDAEDNWVEIDYRGLQGWVEETHLAEQQGSLPDELALLSQSIAAALQEADYSALKDLIQPQLCLRFAPYQYLKDTDQVFCPEELIETLHSDDALIWGSFDGSGEPILLTFQEYHNQFVYDRNFFQPEVVGFDQEVSQGNAINNIPDIYPESVMVEYYFPGFDPQYGGLDWRSLRLVFVSQDGRWYLVALVHGEWTI